MKQVLIRQGEAVLEDVPAPTAEPGYVLVRVSHSCISSGTELAGVQNSGQALWRRAIQHPEEVRKVVQMAASHGLANARSVVQTRLSEGLAVGYSVTGRVTEVGSGIDDLREGQLVACAGAGYASHAEVVRVPRNLVCPVPEGLDARVASTVALGSIALQGVRRAQPTLGETFVVIGLGPIGQLTAQLLKANGCRVIGSDLDPKRIALASSLGMDAHLDPAGGDGAVRILRLTRDVGADGVIITASGSSDAIVSEAFRMCRRRGRVILVGDVGLGLRRQDIYEKELDFLVSTSYGPGRYDHEYEEMGASYPVAYVRWSETRNMQEYLDLAAAGRISVAPLIGKDFPVDAAPEAYKSLSRPESAPVLAILSYPERGLDSQAAVARVRDPAPKGAPAGVVRLAIVGVGGFTKTVHLPNIASMRDTFRLRAVVGRNGARASASAKHFGADIASTDVDSILNDPGVDAILVCTRHDSHARIALQALQAGKHVFVEKPLALTREELGRFRTFYEEGAGAAKPLLLTGYNRRFSPYMRRVRELVAGRTTPILSTYRMNAGHVRPDHWVHGPEGGGRNLGEACHIYDLFTYLVDARVVGVQTQGIAPASGHLGQTDNFVATLRFEEGSVASLVYTSLGNAELAKERQEVFVDGRAIVVDDYRELVVAGSRRKGMKSRVPEKGHSEELRAFADGIRTGSWPIPLWQQMQAAEIALTVQEQLCNLHA